jgi:hypothetical protein
MPHTIRQRILPTACAVALLWTVGSPLTAAQEAPASSTRRAVPVAGQVGSTPASAQDATADQTRQDLERILERYPPAVGRVLKLDPALMNNPTYLSPYPALASFIAQHQEVAHNPAYFLENVNSPNPSYNDPRWRQRQEMNGLLAGVAAFAAFLVVVGLIVWFVRMLINTRRWNKLSKVQYEVHSKLLDRFTANEDLLAYMQTPAGRRFLESAPIQLPDEPRSMGAPFSRILWSAQVGVVLLLTGIGLLYVSSTFIDEPAELFRVLGVVALSLGGGFIVSAVAAYFLSRKLGLLDPAPADHV